MECDLAGRCGGCPSIGRPLADQRRDKRAALVAALGWSGPLTLADVGDAGLRDRLDLQLRRDADRTVIGLGAVGDGKTIVDMARCPLATPALASWLADLRADPPPVARASIRLRVGVDGRRGLWLDVAHTDVKALLDERAWLARAVARAHVELGPKARRVVVEDGVPRLVAPTLAPWFTTWIDRREVPLASRVADFTQPSRAANRALVATIMDHVAATGATRWLELGSGAGNLTLPLAARFDVRAVELDGEALRHNLTAIAPRGPVAVVAQSFTRAADVAGLVAGRDGVLADPPRSGLGPFADGLAGLAPSLRPGHLVYVSCHLEALTKDAAALAGMGYRAVAIDGVDQFPHSAHAEWIVTFTR